MTSVLQYMLRNYVLSAAKNVLIAWRGVTAVSQAPTLPQLFYKSFSLYVYYRKTFWVEVRHLRHHAALRACYIILCVTVLTDFTSRRRPRESTFVRAPA